jgi:hypothetical protein
LNVSQKKKKEKKGSRESGLWTTEEGEQGGDYPTQYERQDTFQPLLVGLSASLSVVTRWVVDRVTETVMPAPLSMQKA